MKRLLLNAAVSLLLGAAFSVALAWLLWAYLPQPSDGQRRDDGWRRYTTTGWPEPVVAARSDLLGRTYVQAWGGDVSDDRGEAPWLEQYAIHVFRAGWPARCVEGALTWSKGYRPGGPVVERHACIPVPPWIPARSAVMPVGIVYASELPIGVVWSGLALDALAFGGAGLGLRWVWVRGRAWLRRRRRRCPRCGYDVRGLGGCPECGPETAPHGAPGRPA